MSKKNLSNQVEMSQNEVLYALDNAGLLEYAQSHGVENLRNALMSITVEKVREYARYEAFIVYAKIPTANDKSQVVENVVSQIQNSPYYCKAKKIVEKAQQIANAVEEPKNTVSKSVEKSNKVEKSNIKEETHMSKKVENAEVNKEMEKLNAELVETMKKLVETTAKLVESEKKNVALTQELKDVRIALQQKNVELNNTRVRVVDLERALAKYVETKHNAPAQTSTPKTKAVEKSKVVEKEKKEVPAQTQKQVAPAPEKKAVETSKPVEKSKAVEPAKDAPVQNVLTLKDMENMTKSDMLTKIDKMSDDDVIASICKITHRRYNCQASTARTMLKEFVEKSNAVEKKNDVELAPKPTAIDAKKQAQATKKAVESTKKVETKKKVETNVSTKSDKLCICNVYAIYTDRTGTVHERHISTTKDVESAKACVLNAHKEYTRTMSKDDPKPQMVSNRAEAYKKFTDTRTMYKTVAYCVESVEL